MIDLYVIDAPHFNVGLLVNNQGVVEEAPPIVKYMKNWNIRNVQSYCKQKRWTFTYIKRSSHTPFP